MLTDDPTDRMWSEACDLLDRAQRMHRQFFRPGAMAPQPANWMPPVDVYDAGNQLWIIAALPGVSPDQVAVTVTRDELTIAGSRPLPSIVRDAAIRRLEIPHGRFERTVQLPPGRFELRRSELLDGCLVLKLIRKN
jgi:HSP20 family protein